MLTIHSGMSPAYLNNRRSGRLLAWTTSRFYRHIIAVNSEIKDVLCSLSVPEARIEILPAFLPAPAALLELPDNFESWSGTHHPVISTTLFFRPEYGFGLLVQAISELRKKHPCLGCVVMGDSESRPEGQKLIREHGLQQHLFAVGDVTHESCLAVIARSDIFVRTTFSDGDAISVREAIALGTPVVASDVVTRPAGILCFKTGDASDLASKIESLLSGEGPYLNERPRMLARAEREHASAKPQELGGAIKNHVASTPGSNGVHRLLELYSS
jgi:glycosyltransferase involved in cell wall biosynthesis